MITGDRPSPRVKVITKGITSDTADTATGWVMDGVCGHGHGKILMGVKGNGGVVKDRP